MGVLFVDATNAQLPLAALDEHLKANPGISFRASSPQQSLPVEIVQAQQTHTSQSEPWTILPSVVPVLPDWRQVESEVQNFPVVSVALRTQPLTTHVNFMTLFQ